jgi:hypothetical protein
MLAAQVVSASRVHRATLGDAINTNNRAVRNGHRLIVNALILNFAR